jgi:hypothetical protein
MEALQMLKFYFKKEWLNFTKDWAITEGEMVENHQEEDLLAKLFEGNYQDGLDRVLHAINGEEDWGAAAQWTISESESESDDSD